MAFLFSNWREYFRGKSVVVTGAASGLGQLMSKRMAALGAHVVLWDKDESGVRAVADAIQAAGGKAAAYGCDLTLPDKIAATAKRTVQDIGTVDILVNNAGVVTGKTLLDTSDAEIRLTFDVNAIALLRTTRAFLPAMIEQGRGHIVTIASAAGLVGTSRLVDYSASKHAAVGFDDALRLELKRLGTSVRTTLVCPFYISTGMFEGARTRFSWLLPIVTPEYAVRRIVAAIGRRRRRLILPRLVFLNYPMRILPLTIFDRINQILGINNTMDEFVGRQKREQEQD